MPVPVTRARSSFPSFDTSEILTEPQRNQLRANTGLVDTGDARLIQPSDPRIVPLGSVVKFAAAIPSGWLLCDGSAVSRVTYSSLFAYIGVLYGVGDGSTTFNLPNLDP